MSIFNNPSSIATGIGSTLIGGIFNKAQSNMTADAEEDSWSNKTGWFGSLIDAQRYSNSVIMAANKERLPFIIEYMTGPIGEYEHTQSGYKNSSNRKAITMYINPSRMQFNNQKITSEVITRGGIFYHHWGDKNTVLSISGDLGLSGMSGVKKLDEVYRMSGVLLAYGENTQGPVYYDGDTDFMNKIASGDWTGAITDVISGKVSLRQAGSAAITHTIGAAQDAITGRRNNGLQSSKIAQKVTSVTGNAVKKVKGVLASGSQDNPIFINGYDENGRPKSSAITNVANAALGTMVNKLGEKIGGKLYSRQGQGALDYLDENIVTYQDAFGGFSDISDELFDPWRPRLITLYFEDHVYIGHFQSFNYTRDAASVNIKYDMSFVIQREIILTSFAPSLPGFEAAINGSEANDMHNQGPRRTSSTGGQFLGSMLKF